MSKDKIFEELKRMREDLDKAIKEIGENYDIYGLDFKYIRDMLCILQEAAEKVEDVDLAKAVQEVLDLLP